MIAEEGWGDCAGPKKQFYPEMRSYWKVLSSITQDLMYFLKGLLWLPCGLGHSRRKDRDRPVRRLFSTV